MTTPTPAAGKTHHVVFKYANDTKTIGLMLPDIRSYTRQPYTPFAPQVREGEATQRDFNITATWEQFNSLHMGIGHIREQPVEFDGYADGQGLDLSGTSTIGPALYTGQRGRLYPPLAETISTTSFSNVKQFIEFNGKLYALTSDAAGKIYEHDGSTWTLRETLTASGTQLFTDGTTLYACQGASNPVRKTTNGTSWSNHTFNAHFMCKREESNTVYVTTNTFTPGSDGTGPTYRSIGIDRSSTAATNLIWYKDSVYIGKPEGLYVWKEGWLHRIVDCSSSVSTDNFTKLTVHRNMLFFNIGHRLYVTSGQSLTEIVPDDLQAFDAIDSLFGVPFGPLLIGARMDGKAYLFYMNGIDEPGLNPLWTDADGSRPIAACCGTTLFSASRARCYFAQTTTGIGYLDFKNTWLPNNFHVKNTTQSYIELTKFTAGFRSVPKWWYEAIFNVEEPSSSVFAQVWYSIDDGAWAQALDENGSPVTLTLNAYNKGCFFPLNTYGVKISIRIYLWTTSASSKTYISAFTLRGSTMVKPRAQIAFPVLAEQYVHGITGDVRMGGEYIASALREMVLQQYPVKFQDPEGTWRLVLFRAPYPLEVTRNTILPTGESAQRFEKTIQLLLVEIDDLNASGGYNAWSVG